MDGGHAWMVREATTEDADRIGAFLRAIWDEAGPAAPGFAGATTELIDELARPDAVRARLGGPTRRIVIAVHQDAVVGFAATRALSSGGVELAGIMVRRAWVGLGIGRALVGAVLELARGSAATSIVVRTEVDNRAAIGFYESLEFRQVRRLVETVDEVEVPVVELTRRI